MVMDSYLQHKHTSFRRTFVGVFAVVSEDRSAIGVYWWSRYIQYLWAYVGIVLAYKMCHGSEFKAISNPGSYQNLTGPHNLGRVSSDMTWHKPPFVKCKKSLVWLEEMFIHPGIQLPCGWPNNMTWLFHWHHGNDATVVCLVFCSKDCMFNVILVVCTSDRRAAIGCMR